MIKNADFAVKIAGIHATALYDAVANMICMFHTCFNQSKDPPSLRNIHVLSMHSAVGHALCPTGLIQYGVILGNTHIICVCYTLNIINGFRMN